MSHSRACSVLIASLLLATLANTGTAQANTTYTAEIEKRQARIREIDNRMEELNRELRVKQGTLADFVKVCTTLERYTAALEGREVRYTPDSKVGTWTGEVTAIYLMLQPSPEPSTIVAQAFKNAPIDPVPIMGGRHVIHTGGDLLRTYRQLKGMMPEATQEEADILAGLDILGMERQSIIPELNALYDARDEAEARSLIEGKWILTTANNNTIIYVYFSEADKNLIAVIDTNNLPFFKDLDQLFIAGHVQDDPQSFVGREYGYNSKGKRVTSTLNIHIEGDTMIYNNGDETLTWVRYRESRSLLGGQ